MKRAQACAYLEKSFARLLVLYTEEPEEVALRSVIGEDTPVQKQILTTLGLNRIWVPLVQASYSPESEVRARGLEGIAQGRFRGG